MRVQLTGSRDYHKKIDKRVASLEKSDFVFVQKGDKRPELVVRQLTEAQKIERAIFNARIKGKH